MYGKFQRKGRPEAALAQSAEDNTISSQPPGRKHAWWQRLNGIDPSLLDEIAAPETYAALFAYMGAKETAVPLGQAGAWLFQVFRIADSPLRIAHFLAQAAFETVGFRYLHEIWGPTPAQNAYEGRADLGNTQPGDGYKFRGRGIFQLTGRDNYTRYGRRLGLDLIENPELAAKPDTALHIACLYWNDLGLNYWADADDILAVSNGINRGNPRSVRKPNGYAGREAALRKIKATIF